MAYKTKKVKSKKKGRRDRLFDIFQSSQAQTPTPPPPPPPQPNSSRSQNKSKWVHAFNEDSEETFFDNVLSQVKKGTPLTLHDANEKLPGKRGKGTRTPGRNNLLLAIKSQSKKQEKQHQVYEYIREALIHEKKAPYGRTKLMIVGEGRAGKTSSIKALLNQKFDPTETSTKGFDVMRVDASDWREDTKSYLVEYLETAIMSDRRKKETEESVSKATSKLIIERSRQQAIEQEKVKSSQKSNKSKVGEPQTSERQGLAKSSTKEQETGEGGNEQSKKAQEATEGPSAVGAAAREVKVSEEEVKRYGKNITMADESGNSLGFSIWDFGGQRVFYTLHHLFLTEYGCYGLVFDMNKLFDESTRLEAVEYLKFWLFSKKIHAPSAPMIMIGTHASEFTFAQTRSLDKVLVRSVLGHHEFNEYRNGSFTFFPIDNKTGAGIPALRRKIEQIVKGQAYVKDEVPVSFLRVLELLLELKADYIMISEVVEIMKSCGLSIELFGFALEFLNQRGLITYFSQPENLSRFVILQPQWLINGITDIVFDENEHELPYCDQKYNGAFRRFLNNRVISLDLLHNIWQAKHYSDEVQTFFKNVMLRTALMCPYKFDTSPSFLIPSLFTTENNLTDMATEESDYSGPYFIINFSGDYVAEVVEDDGKRFVRYLPFGMFERLVCLCVEHSATFDESVRPDIMNQIARLSFGVEIDFEIKVALNESKEQLWIKVSTEQGTSYKAARELVKLIYSMLDALKEDYFPEKSNLSALSLSLLLPSSKQSGEMLAEYFLLRTRREAPEQANNRFRPSRLRKTKARTSDFWQWFGDNQVAEQDSLTEPNAKFKMLAEKDPKFQSLQKAVYKPLKNKLKYHCFLSYKQSSAIDLVGKQFYILSGKGYKCWYDQQLRGEITLKSMQEGVRQSMCYILFLSEDIFPSFFVEEEIKMALKLNKPIIFLHHPKTGRMGYWNFGDYINKAPEVLKPLFAKVESIELQRRYYLEQAVNEMIDQKLTNILNSL